MPLDDPAALVSAVITARPLCIWCITEVTRFTPQRVRSLVEGVKGYREALDHCTGCGIVSVVMSCERRPSRNGHL